jgi:MAM domain, meprin/A5/mu
MGLYYEIGSASDQFRTTRIGRSGIAGRRPRPRKIDLVGMSLSLCLIFGILPAQANEMGPPRPSLTMLDRTLTQDQGAWVVEYRLRNSGRTGVIVTPDELKLKIEGWVSNSRVASHAVPRWSSLIAVPRTSSTACSDVITAADESHRCRERLAISVWTEEGPRPDTGSVANRSNPPKAASVPAPSSATGPLLPLSLGPGDTIHLRLRIDHDHILYGDYDPLLGIRTVELCFGSSVVRDVVPLDREQYLAQPKYTWPEPPDDRRDTGRFVTAPDSLHLAADVAGHQSYRFQERPVRYSTKMRLRFWYLIAAGTEGEARVRIAQNKDTPLLWRQLHEATVEEQLKTIGRWTKYECIIQTEPEATRLILEFKIVGEVDIGEMWIDDVNLEPLASSAPIGP